MEDNVEETNEPARKLTIITPNKEKGGFRSRQRRPSLGTALSSHEKKRVFQGKQRKLDHERKKAQRKKLKFKVGNRSIDPLNLMGIKEGYNSPKLVESPLLSDRGHNFDPDDVRPVDMTDPLKLNNLDDDVLAVKVNAHKRKRRRRRRRTMSENDKDMGADLNNLGHDMDTEPSENEAQSPVMNKTPKIAAVFEEANSAETEQKEEKLKREHEKEENNAEKEAETPLVKADVKTETKKTHKHQDKRKHHDRGHNKHHHDSNNKEPQQNNKINFREKDKRFQYGNYNKYYGYRNPNMSEDDRIEYMKKEWFENKDCLDIGCNVGHLTLYIGRHYNPKSLLGIDIDDNLIKSARNNIRHYIPLKGPQAPKQSDFPISFPICLGPLAAPVVPEKTGKSFGFPFNTSFKTVSKMLPADHKRFLG